MVEVNYGKALTDLQRVSSGQISVYGSSGVVGSHNEALTNGPTIVIGRKGTVGAVHLSKAACWPIDTTYYIEPPSEISIEYLYYTLKGLNLEKLEKSTAVPGLNRNDLYAQKIPLAPLPEQKRIVAELEAQLSQLDQAEDSLKRQQNNLPRYKASVLKAACEGRLVPQDSNDEHADQLLKRILDERRTRWEAEQLAKAQASGKLPLDELWKEGYKEPKLPDFEELPGLPSGWCWATVEQLGNTKEQTVLTGPFGSNLGQKDFVKQGVPVLTIGCLTEQGLSLDRALYITTTKAEELSRYRVKEGDLLFSRMASVGRAALITTAFVGAVINYHLMRLRLNSILINPNYFLLYVRGSSVVSEYIREVNHGATRDGINTDQLLGLPVALPPLAEQQRIVAEAEFKLSTSQQQKNIIEANLKRSERLRQSLLQKAFLGELVPQNPADEPANQLLVRIKAAREEREKQRQAELAAQRANPVKKEKKKMSTRQRRSLREVLLEVNTKLTPRELFSQAGFTVETIEDFYTELRQEVLINRNIEEERSGSEVYLKVVS